MPAAVATADTAKNNPGGTGGNSPQKSSTDTSSRVIMRSEMRTRYETRAQDRRKEGRLKPAAGKSRPHDGQSKLTKAE